MAKEPNQPKARMKYVGHIQQKELRRQASDSELVKRFQNRYGCVVVGDRECWTNIKTYVQEPTLRHPLNIKHAMNNPAGDCFVQFPTIEEYDLYMLEHSQWREKNDKWLRELQHDENILKQRRHILKKIEEVLSDTKTPLPRISLDDEILNNNFEQLITEKCFDLIDRLLRAINGKQIRMLTKDLRVLFSDLNEKQPVIDYMKLRIDHMNIDLNNNE